MYSLSWVPNGLSWLYRLRLHCLKMTGVRELGGNGAWCYCCSNSTWDSIFQVLGDIFREFCQLDSLTLRWSVEGDFVSHRSTSISRLWSCQRLSCISACINLIWCEFMCYHPSAINWKWLPCFIHLLTQGLAQRWLHRRIVTIVIISVIIKAPMANAGAGVVINHPSLVSSSMLKLNRCSLSQEHFVYHP